jgi:ubiquinone/menaquinone biosynthesis C-methylase UbiE
MEKLYNLFLNMPILADLIAGTLGASPTSRYRKRATTSLKLNGASRILDVGCGSGRNFALLHDAVSHIGLVCGIDPSAQAIRQAHRRIEKHGYRDIALVQTPAEEYHEKHPFDAVLCTFAIEKMEKWEEGLGMMVGAVKVGGRIAVLGVKTSDRRLGKLGSPVVRFVCKRLGFDLGRGVREMLKKKGCEEVVYEEYFGGFYYLVVVEKRED